MISQDLGETRPKTNVRLNISANNLKDLDVFTKSDPICVVFEKIGGAKGSAKITQKTWKDHNWIEKGRTEMIKNDLNPSFMKTIQIPYFFEENQLLRFELFDVDDEKNVSNFESHDFLGRFECTLAEIVSYSNLKAHLGKEDEIGRRWRSGDKASKNGSITIRAEEDEKCETFKFKISGVSLDKKDFFGKSDPYLLFRRKFEDGNWRTVHKTEIRKNTLNPDWTPISLNLKSLCGGDLNQPITIECFDWDSWKKDDLIGICQFTINQLITENPDLELINERKKSKRSYKNSGILKFINPQIIIEPTFLDYLAGGTQLDFAVAVDFTASNGQISLPSSLHYVSNEKPNQYEIALLSCLQICQHYNSRKTFDAFGFGAKISPNPQVQNVFHLNLNPDNPEVSGIRGVLTAYRQALHRVQLYGPTNFAPIIDRIAQKAAEMLVEDSRRYQILLIITDGIISDMMNTIKTIINASGLPLSIIIIGVGNEDFDKMHELDSDNRLLEQDSRIAQRDIVQFVTLRQFLNNGQGQWLDPDIVMRNLAREVLQEIPEQLVGYMKMRGISPRDPSTPWQRQSPPPEYDPHLDQVSSSTISPRNVNIGFVVG
ncbi:unnamed protein product [Caenorhabditis angaria]|uniref:C2 domain-containing protein n=1 Tax=Caenorhabditis angaria TaxID=860376 RepID=A0A9P1N430_9PELO|nr:unnamed protein product [Caenorhabditis angaria]